MPPVRVGAWITCGVFLVVKARRVLEVLRVKNLPVRGDIVSIASARMSFVQEVGITLHIFLYHLLDIHVRPEGASKDIQRPAPGELGRQGLVFVEIVLCEARFRAIVCMGGICKLEQTANSNPRADAFLDRASLALNAKKLRRTIDANLVTGEMNKHTKPGGKASIFRVGDCRWIVSNKRADLVGRAGFEIVFEAERCSVAIGYTQGST